MNKNRFETIWIFTLGLIVICAGFIFAFIVPCLFPMIQDLFYHSFQHNQSIQSLSALDHSHINWIYGVLGSVLIGWGAMIVLLSWRLFKENVLWIWNTIIISVIIWYIIDSGISLYYQVFLNFALNSVILILALIPYYLNRKKVIHQ